VICIPSIAASALCRSCSRQRSLLGTSIKSRQDGLQLAFVEGLGAGWGHDGTHAQTPSWPRFPHRNEGLQFGEASQFVVACRGFSWLHRTIIQRHRQRNLMDIRSALNRTLEQIMRLLTKTPTNGLFVSSMGYIRKTLAWRWQQSLGLRSALAIVMRPVTVALPVTSFTFCFAPVTAISGSAPSWTAAPLTGGKTFSATANRRKPRDRWCAGWNLCEAAQ
jgi:hypothetical protein